MAIKIVVGQEPQALEATQEEVKPTQAKMFMNARKALNGDIMIFDHKDIDIVLVLEKKKIMTFPKEILDDFIYETQDRLFKFLIKKGVVDPESIQGGNIHMSMEGKIFESEEHNSSQVALFTIGKFIEEERPYFEAIEAHERAEEERLLEPDPDESTEFDPEKYHDATKGSIRPGIRPYGIAGIYRI